MQAHQTIEGEGTDQVLRAPYRVHLWECPTENRDARCAAVAVHGVERSDASARLRVVGGDAAGPLNLHSPGSP